MVLTEHRRWLIVCPCLQVHSVDSLLTPTLRIGLELEKSHYDFWYYSCNQSFEMRDVRVRNDIYAMAWLLGPS